jgi:hypothetical protein
VWIAWGGSLSMSTLGKAEVMLLIVHRRMVCS